jgi:hypothetical protein
MIRLIDYLVEWWLKQCPHDDRHAVADFLQADALPLQLQWCRRCGAARVVYEGQDTSKKEWDRPRPIWFPHGKNMT